MTYLIISLVILGVAIVFFIISEYSSKAGRWFQLFGYSFLMATLTNFTISVLIFVLNN